MIDAARMAQVDRNAAALGVPRKQLMESSGNAVARAVREATAPGDAVAVLAGRGNNGGDGLVAARFLDDRDVTVHLLGRAETIRTDIARENWRALRAGEYDAREVRDATALPALGVPGDGDGGGEGDGDRAGDATGADGGGPTGDDGDGDGGEGGGAAENDEGGTGEDRDERVRGNGAAPAVVVDAMLGTGVSGALRDPERTAAARANASPATVVSVDVPSGVDPDTGTAAAGAVEADRVVTFHDAKPGLADVDASVTVADIGIPAAAERLVGPGDLLALTRHPEGHKGQHGEVLVVGGGPYSGAPALAARAALRGGADLVRLAVPAAVADAVRGYDESLIVHDLPGDRVRPGDVDPLLDRARAHDSVVLGPGLGDDERTLTAVERFLDDFSGRAVVDADALAAVPAVGAGAGTAATLVCTPHAGELRGMGGPDVDDPDLDRGARRRAVADFAADLGHTLLVKGPRDVVSDGTDTRENVTGNAGMTVGGTGDVLAGLTGALLASLSPLQAAAVGAYANGLAGDRALGPGHADADGDGNGDDGGAGGPGSRAGPGHAGGPTDRGVGGYGLLPTDLIDRLPAALWGDRDG